jgi:capsular exopolysaccharide synthesis family protein
LDADVDRGLLLDLGVAAKRLALRPFLGAEPAEDEHLGRLSDSIEIEIVRNTSLLLVSFTSPDPELSALGANVVAREFIDEDLEGKYRATTRAADFLARQLDELEARIADSEAKLLRYARESGIVNLAASQTIARKRLADLNDALTAAETEMIALGARAGSAETTLEQGLPDSLKSERVDAIEARLADRELELAGLEARFGSEWPAVEKLRLEIGVLRQHAATERKSISQAAQGAYRLARSEHSQLSAAIDAQRRLVDDLDERSIQYDILRRESESTKELYAGLLQRLKQASVAARLDSSNLQIVEDADPPRSTSAPRKARTLAIALLLGLFLGTAAAVLAERIDDSVKTEADVTALLRRPTLARIPFVGERDRQRLFGRRRRGSTEPVVLAFEPSHAVEGPVAEAYRSLRTSLLVAGSTAPPALMLVSSALDGEGRSTTALNTAIAFSQTGERTLLLEHDLRRPSLAKAVGVVQGPGRGLEAYLRGDSDLWPQVCETRFENLSLLPAGGEPADPANLLGSQRMATALELVRQSFTYVVIDTPPILSSTDALLVAAHCDGVILVVEGGRTPRQALREAAGRFNQVGARLLGVVLHDLGPRRAAR